MADFFTQENLNEQMCTVDCNYLHIQYGFSKRLHSLVALPDFSLLQYDVEKITHWFVTVEHKKLTYATTNLALSIISFQI